MRRRGSCPSPWGLSLVQRIGPVDPRTTDFRHRLLDIFVQHLRGAGGIGRTSESVVFEWIQEIDPELVKIAHVAGHDRQPMHHGRRGDHGILQQGV